MFYQRMAATVSVTAFMAAALGLPGETQGGDALGAGGLANQFVQTTTPAARPGPVNAATEIEYRLAPGDRIFVFVDGHPDLSGELTIRPDGRISTPLVTDLAVADKTVSEVASELKVQLARYITAPVVSVDVTNAVGLLSQQIRVIGAAADPRVDIEGPRAVQQPLPTKPAAVPYRAGMTLLDVMLQVGGLSQFANGNRGYIVRRLGARQVEVPVRLDDLLDDRDMTANVAMAPGDIVVIPEGPLSGDWSWASRAGAFVTGTDNVGLSPDGEKNPALIFSLTPGFSVRGTTPRFYGGADVDLLLNYQEVYGNRQSDEAQGFDPYLSFLGTSTTELVRDNFFVDAGASIQQQTSGLGDATSVSEFVQTNRQTTAVINASPYIPMALSNLATAQLRYTFGAFFEGEENAAASDSFSNIERSDIIHELGWNAASTPTTSSFGLWEFLIAGALEITDDDEDDEEDSDIKTGLVKLDWAYPITAQVDGLASVGWDYRDEDDPDNDINDPRGGVGARWRPSPALDAKAMFGYADARSNVSADLRYDPSPRTFVFAAYQEGVSTAARLLVDSLGLIRIDPQTGEFLNEETGALYDPFFQGAGRGSTETQFIREMTAGAQTEQGNNVFALNSQFFSEEPEDDGAEEKSFSISASWERAFSTRTTGNVTLMYLREKLEDRDDNTYVVLSGLTYQLTDAVEAQLIYGFQDRDSTTSDFDFTENVLTIGAIARF